MAKVLDNPTIRCCSRDWVQSISLATTRKRVLGWISSCSETKYSKSGTMAGRLRDQVPIVLGLSYHHYPREILIFVKFEKSFLNMLYHLDS